MVPAQRLHQNGQMEAQTMIDEFLLGETYAVAGASTDRGKYGNKVFRCYQQAGKAVIPLNPRADEVEGVECIRDLSELPVEVYGLSIITPPRVRRFATFCISSMTCLTATCCATCTAGAHTP